MSRFATVLLGLTFVIAVAALVLALWPVVADAPWELPKTQDGRMAKEWCDYVAKTDGIPQQNFVQRSVLKVLRMTDESVSEYCLRLWSYR